mmetsp:Transcript_18389/g.60124  ORF Transcript_18389/g.60124 Transcript_18389/m.60124 type:complete len:261 (-) Transcript_18389:147-929(-)
MGGGAPAPGAPGAGDDDNACADAGPIRAILADVGDDEALDVLVAFADDQSIGYYYANDADQIVEFATVQASNTYDDPVYVVALDVDGDGALDVACSYPDIGTIYWFLWKNGAWTDYAVDQDAGDPTTLDAADIDGDNDVDLLASNDVVVAYGNVLHEGDDAAFEAAFEVMWEASDHGRHRRRRRHRTDGQRRRGGRHRRRRRRRRRRHLQQRLRRGLRAGLRGRQPVADGLAVRGAERGDRVARRHRQQLLEPRHLGGVV